MVVVDDVRTANQFFFWNFCIESINTFTQLSETMFIFLLRIPELLVADEIVTSFLNCSSSKNVSFEIYIFTGCLWEYTLHMNFAISSLVLPSVVFSLSVLFSLLFLVSILPSAFTLLTFTVICNLSTQFKTETSSVAVEIPTNFSSENEIRSFFYQFHSISQLNVILRLCGRPASLSLLVIRFWYCSSPNSWSYIMYIFFGRLFFALFNIFNHKKGLEFFKCDLFDCPVSISCNTILSE